MEKKAISPLRAIIYLVEIGKRQRRLFIEHCIMLCVFSPVLPIVGYLLNFPWIMIALGNIVVGLILWEFTKIRKAKLKAEVIEFWNRHTIDISLEK